MFNKIKQCYSSQNDMTKGMIWVGLVLLIMIIIRWNHVVEGIARGFNFYSDKGQ